MTAAATAPTSTAAPSSAPNGWPVRCTQAEFARLNGWSKSYVTALKHEGRLVMGDDGLVVVQASLLRIKATTGAPERAAPPVQGRAYSDAQDRERFYSAELRRLEYEREVRRVRVAEEVDSAVADAGALVRTTVEAWRDRLPVQLAALGGDEQRIGALLGDECERLLRRLSERFAALAAAEPAPQPDGAAEGARA